ncbi:MAG: hypothetical protein QXI32_04875 [Candidatus Bathyarchaeia archaeon]
MEKIGASNLTKFYGEIVDVDHISFEVREAEIFSILGPNDADKTTTIHMFLLRASVMYCLVCARTLLDFLAFHQLL